MTSGEPKDPKEPKSPNDSDTGAGSALPRISQSELVASDVTEVLRSEKAVNINIDRLLIYVQEKSENPRDMVANTEKMLDLAAKFERQRVEALKARADTVIDAKSRDPDEIDKRANNRTRRHLKYVQAGVAVGSIASSVVLLSLSAPIVPIVVLLAIGAINAGMIPMLASGESVSSDDVVKVVNAVVRVTSKAFKPETNSRNGKKRKG